MNGSEVALFFDGEPEDANLSRNFNDCWGIIALMEQAWKAGKAGETFDYSAEEIDVGDD